MRTKKGLFTLKGETFPYDVIIALGVNRAELLTYIDKRFKNCLTAQEREDLDLSVNGKTLQLENRAYILWVRDFPRDPVSFAHLQHEIFHTVDLMLRSAGIKLSNDSDEVWAYHIHWFTQKIYTAFKLV